MARAPLAATPVRRTLTILVVLVVLALVVSAGTALLRAQQPSARQVVTVAAAQSDAVCAVGTAGSSDASPSPSASTTPAPGLPATPAVPTPAAPTAGARPLARTTALPHRRAGRRGQGDLPPARITGRQRAAARSGSGRDPHHPVPRRRQPRP